MKAAILRALNVPLSVETLAMPEPAAGQLLVRVAAAGVCHSQLHEVRGRRGPDRWLPHLLGHEASGVVEAVGPEVTRAAPGDHVVLSWIKGAGRAAASPAYRDAAGAVVNAGPIATFADWTLVSEDRVTRIRPEMPLDLAALLGCAVATGAGAVFNTAKVVRGQSVAVFGAGGIGLNAVQAARVAGADPVIAVDVHDCKLKTAEAFGATRTVDARRGDPAAAIRELTGGSGADVAIETAGRRETMEAAFSSVRAKGGLTVLVGNLPAGQSISIDPFQLIAGKRIIGCWGGDTDPGRDIPAYVDLYLAGKLKLAELVSHRFPLEGVNEALDALERGEVSRALLEFPSPTGA